jgi:hypothetical protein
MHAWLQDGKVHVPSRITDCVSQGTNNVSRNRRLDKVSQIGAFMSPQFEDVPVTVSQGLVWTAVALRMQPQSAAQHEVGVFVGDGIAVGLQHGRRRHVPR